jgi:hypothetical protein
MGWTISSAGKSGEAGLTVRSSPCKSGAQWRFIPNADRTTSGKAGSIPAWQAKQVCQSVLSTLVGDV